MFESNVYTTSKCFKCLTYVKKVSILLKSKFLYTNSLSDWGQALSLKGVIISHPTQKSFVYAIVKMFN